MDSKLGRASNDLTKLSVTEGLSLAKNWIQFPDICLTGPEKRAALPAEITEETLDTSDS